MVIFTDYTIIFWQGLWIARMCDVLSSVLRWFFQRNTRHKESGRTAEVHGEVQFGSGPVSILSDPS